MPIQASKVKIGNMYDPVAVERRWKISIIYFHLPYLEVESSEKHSPEYYRHRKSGEGQGQHGDEIQRTGPHEFPK